jgi:hypothetical protein
MTNKEEIRKRFDELCEEMEEYRDSSVMYEEDW